VVAHSSRLTRLDPDEALMYSIQVRRAGGRIYSHDEPHFGAPDKVGRLLSLLAMDDNYEYSQTLSGHVRRKFRNEIDANNAFRGAPPAGYEVTGEKYRKRLVPANARREATRRRKVDGVKAKVTVTLPSAEDAKNLLMEASTNMKTSLPKLSQRFGLTIDTVRTIIRNPVYSTGRYEIRSACGSCAACAGSGNDKCVTPRIVIHHCDALVSPEVQRLAIASLARRYRGDNVTPRAIRKDDLSGALFCPHCGSALYRYYSSGRKRKDGARGPKVRRYACSGKDEKGRSCSKSVRADNADAAVDALMSSRQYPWMRSRLIEGNDHSAELQRLQDELAGLGARRLPRAEMQAETDRLYDLIEQLESLPIIPSRIVIEIARREDGTVITEADHWQGLTPAERRAYLLYKAGAQDAERVIVTPAPGRTGRVIAEIENHSTGVEHGSEAA